MTHKPMTLGQLARKCGLARVSLLHYESLGLLVPAARSEAGYRLYGEKEVARLAAIRRYRDAGLSLPAIRELLAGHASNAPAQLLENRLLALCNEMDRLREQQQMLARLLATPEFRARHACKGKAAWIALLRRAGFSDDDMMAWHRGFEASSPAEHEAFLRSLDLGEDEVAAIRQASRPTASPPSHRG